MCAPTATAGTAARARNHTVRAARPARSGTSVDEVHEQLVVPCVGALVYDAANRLLLIRRGRAPSRGRWSVPGGRVEAGESLAQAVVREVREETGLRVRADRVVGTVERAGRAGEVYAITDFAATWLDGRLRPGDDADDARFVTAVELAALTLSPGLLEALTEWAALPG